MALKDIIKSITDPKDTDVFLTSFPNKVGSYGYDPWGFNINGIKPFVGAGKFFYEN